MADIRQMTTNDVQSVVVDTKHGKLRGEILQAVTGDATYVSFKGIPYAKPPTGDLRFMAPQPPESWSGVRNATQHGSICIQLSIYNQKDIAGSEDCLYLNVYTPEVNPKHRLPVMVYIHGGGFQSGSGNSDRFGPDYLMSNSVVLVTINYRLGAFGFLSLNLTEAPGNAAMKDQVAALKWVQNNIAKFGGDPSKVTIFGQSAGAACVTLHNLSPMSKGLYKRSIAMSGVLLNDFAMPFEPRRLAFKLGQQLGIWTHDDKELLVYLKSLPAERFLAVSPAVLRSQTPNIPLKQLIFTPVVETVDDEEEHFLVMDPTKSLKQGKVHNVDLMLGHTALEGFIYLTLTGNSVPDLFTNYTEMIVPTKIVENVAPRKCLKLADKIHKKYFGDMPINNSVVKQYVRYISETYFNYGITKFAKIFSNFRKTFMYKFSLLTNFPRNLNLDNEYGINESTHEDDLLYLLYPNDGNVTIDKDSDDYKGVKTMCTLYTNFAKYGNPTYKNSLGIEWPQYNNLTQYYLNIDKKLTVGQHLDADTVSFWDAIYEAVKLELKYIYE